MLACFLREKKKSLFPLSLCNESYSVVKDKVTTIIIPKLLKNIILNIILAALLKRKIRLNQNPVSVQKARKKKWFYYIIGSFSWADSIPGQFCVYGSVLVKHFIFTS